MLLDKGAGVNAQGRYYGNALQAASLGGYNQVVQILLDKGADVNAQGRHYGNALQAASSGGHNEVVQMLLDNTASITDMQRRNCLHHAASKGSTDLVTWLLEQGFDPNLTDRDGWTSLHWAAKNRSIETIRILKGAGAASSIEAIKGWTPRSVAVYHHNESSVIPAPNITSGSPQSGPALMPTFSSPVFEIDGDKIIPGVFQGGFYCDGCFLVSQESDVLKVLSSDSIRTYIAHDIDV
jgi:hypothetical protein